MSMSAVVCCAAVLFPVATARAASRPLSHPALTSGADHECVAGSGQPQVAWSVLKNPVLSDPTAGIKDQAIVWYGQRWHMLMSEITYDRRAPGGVRWNIATASSADLVHWSAIRPWPLQRGVLGVASPDIVRNPAGSFVVTYQSDPGEVGGRQDRLYYRTSNDLRTWSAPRPLAQNLAPRRSDRMIDGALAWTGNGVILAYKTGLQQGVQHMEVAWSSSGSLAGPWRLVGPTDINVVSGTVENYELLVVNGSWRLVATSNNLDQPWIFNLAGNPLRPTSWLHWTDARELQVPGEAWNSGQGVTGNNYEHANSAFLCVVGPEDYLWYAGSTELSAFGGWGHAKIGVARSPDLENWQVPPG